MVSILSFDDFPFLGPVAQPVALLFVFIPPPRFY